MADLTIREKFFDDLAKGARWDVGVSIARGNPLPLDANSVFESYADLETYAAGVLAYPGQVVAVVNADSTGIYYLDQEKAIKPVGVIPAGDELSVDMDDSDVISLHNFGKVFYKYVAEVGDVAAHYEKVVVSDTNPWVAGLEPRVVTEDGKLVLGWYEPNPTTIDGVNDQVTAVQGTVSGLVNSVGAPSTENSEATGLYKEVEDVQEDVKELTDAVGNSDDALSDDVQTLWAHVNDHAGRLEELEAIDHSLLATKEELAAEADRADKAEKANAAAIKVIADDYLKAADIANMATDAEVEAAVKAEADRAKGVEESLQNQINLIMDNPETENVIDSINEFVTYIEEHGNIADGFRTDINKNKDDIAAEIERATGAEGTLSDRLDVLEAIDHDAYIAADATLKAELEAEIEKKADAETVVNDIATAKQAAIDAAAADATTKADAAKDAAIADAAGKYYAKSETYTQAEIDELLEGIQGGASESAASVKTQLDAYKKIVNNEVWGNEAGTGDSRIDTLDTKVKALEDVGSQANVIEAVKVNGVALAIDENKAVNVVVPTKFSDLTDDSGFNDRITTAKNQADKGISDAAAADAKAVANAEAIGKQETRIGALETAKSDHETRIISLENADSQHASEYNALKGIVDGHTTSIAAKADQTALDAVSAKASTNEAAIKTLNETTIPGINGEIGKKANAADVYTKTEVGAIAEGKTLVQMIADAKSEATYDDSEVRQLIADEADRATKAEAANNALISANAQAIADEKARAEGVESGFEERIAEMETFWAAADDPEGTIDKLAEIVKYIESDKSGALDMAADIAENAATIAAIYTPAEGEVAASGVLVTEIARVEGKADANAQAIAAINNADTGILAQAKGYTDAAIAGLPVATAEVLGLVKFDDATIKMNDNKQLYVAKVSTDILEQGTQVLVLNGGSATE